MLPALVYGPLFAALVCRCDLSRASWPGERRISLRVHRLFVRGYLGLVFLLGLTFGLAELVTPPSGILKLQRPDPVLFFLSERSAVVVASVLLLAVAVLAVIPCNAELRLAGILIGGVVLGTYQLTRLLFGVAEPCQCLQGVATVLGLKPADVAVLKYVVIAILVVPAALLLRWNLTKPIPGH